MCTALGAFVGLTAAGSVLGGISGYQSSKYNAAVARNNAQIEKYAAQDALRRGDEAKAELRARVRAQRVAGRGGFAAGNVALGQGSALQWEQDLDASELSDLTTIESNAQQEAAGFRTRSQNERARAGMLRAQAPNALAASLIGGATSIAGIYAARGN